MVRKAEPKVQMNKKARELRAWLDSQSVDVRKKFISDLQEKNGGFTKEALEGICVTWPPPKGWRKRFTDRKQKLRRQKKKKSRQPRKIARVQGKKVDAFYSSYEWRKLRYAAIKLCGGKCMACGRSPYDGAVLHVDHIKPRRKYPELALVLSNLQVLCNICNHGKGNWDETDWREPRIAALMGEAV